MTKGDLMSLVLTKEEQRYCDSAIPMHLWEGIDTSLHVFDCKNNQLVNLAEKLITSGKLKEITDELKELKYEKKHLVKAIKDKDLDCFFVQRILKDEPKKKEIPNGHTFSEFGG